MIKIYDYDKTGNNSIFARGNESGSVAEVVAAIIEDVRTKGDAALFRYCEKFDKASLTSLEVGDEEIEEAFNSLDGAFIAVLKEAAENIRDFHSRQIRQSFVISEKEGVITGQKITPIEKVGIYAPGGTAAYPSSVLMNCIPAKLAGCGEIIMTTPATGGKINPAILAAAKIAGVDRVFKLGGAQAIAALAYGSESVPAVNKIVGPGNAYVAEAKKQVFGRVGIDMIAGPSEILIIADGKSKAEYVAADMLSQAEHDRLASAVLITESAKLGQAVRDELERQLPLLPRYDIARASIDNNGKIIIAKSIYEAIEIANKIAPEHLELCLDNPFDYLDAVKNAGSVFMGRYCPEALGDYFAGPNHVLPTGGSAKFSNPLSLDDFIKKTQFTYYTGKALNKIADKVELFAQREGLAAHAESVAVRRNQNKNKDRV